MLTSAVQRSFLWMGVALGILVLGYVVLRFLGHIKIVVTFLTISVILAYILDPIVRYFIRLRLPRLWAIIISYLSVISIFTIFFVIVIPIVTREFNQLLADFPKLLQQGKETLVSANNWYSQKLPAGFRDYLAGIAERAAQELEGSFVKMIQQTFGAIFRVFSVGAGIIIVSIFTFYMLLEASSYRKQFISLFPHAWRVEVEQVVDAVHRSLGGFVRGQLIVCAFIGFAVTVALLIAGIPYAFFIGFFAGVVEIIPFVGAYAGAVPALVLAFMKSPMLALVLAGVFILIYTVQSKVIYPNVLGHKVGFSPLLVLVVVLMGAELAGLFGMFIAVPVTAILRVLFYYIHGKLVNNGPSVHTV